MDNSNEQPRYGGGQRTTAGGTGSSDSGSGGRFRKGRSLTSPVSASTSLVVIDQPGGLKSPFMTPNAFDESGTVISPRFLRSVNTPEYIENVPYLRDVNRTKYEEAALFVQEGVDNDKFASHPNGKVSKIAFSIAHHPAFYITEFVVCCLLLALAIIEFPAWIPIPATNEKLSVIVHALLEMIFLSIIAFNILLRFMWMKPRTFLKQRSTFTAIMMIIMFLEAMIVLIRQDSHFRVTRCLRPIFFIDSYIMAGVRRVLRQLIQCIKPIADVMILLFFMIAIFALAGFYLFADINPTFFDSYLKAFVSLFITLTTANHPDVFMEAYVRKRASPIFFILYLFVTLYFFSNVLLAVVYAHFSEVDKEKFRKLYLHKREALRLAFFVLAKDSEGINFNDFLLFMLEYKPHIPEYQVMCIFKALQFNPDPQESLCLEEFLQFYEMQNFVWKKLSSDDQSPLPWYNYFHKRIKPVFTFLEKVVKFKYFDSIIALVVMGNAIYLVLFALITSKDCSNDGADSIAIPRGKCGEKRFMASYQSLIGSFLFIAIYMIEIAIRILAVGPIDYFKKWWNRFDFFVILLSFIFLCVEASSNSTVNDVRSFLVVARPVKLFRLLRLKKSYHDIMNTVFVIGHRLLSVLLLLLVVFYFYAIVGMEVFQGKVYVGCCEKALFGVGSYYQTNTTPHESTVYWLNNFDNIYQSYVILYEEMVVNNWFVQMEGFVSETNIYSRLYFFSFWITTTICLSVVIAYIVDAFVFRIQLKNQRKKCDIHPDLSTCSCNNNQDLKQKKKVKLEVVEINTLNYGIAMVNEIRRKKRCFFPFSFFVRSLRRKVVDLNKCSNTVNLIGKRLRTREDLYLQMHKDELASWVEERDIKLRELRSSPQKKKSLAGIIWETLKKFFLFLIE